MQPITRRHLAGCAAAAAAAPLAQAQARPADSLAAVHRHTPRNLLAPFRDSLAGALIPREKWRPYPTGAGRDAWERLPAEARACFIEAGERALSDPWPDLHATRMLEYTRVGNRTRYDSANAARRAKLRALTMAETVEGKGRFLDEVLNGIWLFCEQSFWGSPAHVHYQKAGAGLPDIADPTVDLFAGDAAAELAWAVYFLGHALDRISPLIRERVRLEVDRRVLTPCIETQQHWMVRGMNWNPWCTSNWLIANLLLERDESRRRAAVAKSLWSLDNFLNLYPEDGGCDEGPSYWGVAGGALFKCLELLRSATAGKVDIYGAPLVREIGRYICRAHVHGEWFLNFADAPARLKPDGAVVYRYGTRIGDPAMAAFGAWLLRNGGRGADDLDLLFAGGLPASAPAYQPLPRDVWLKDIQVFAARLKERSPEGFYIAGLAGHNAESHNHNDVGNFVVFFDGEPVVVDVGPETYSAKTFTKERYSIWTMSSAYHNVPEFAGVTQRGGRQWEAREVEYRADDAAAGLSMNIAPAYPPEAGVEHWRRTLRLDRARDRVEVLDRHRLNKPVPEIALTLMTPCAVAISGSGLTFETKAGRVAAEFEGPPGLTAAVEEIAITDERLRGVWGKTLRRIRLKAANPPLEGAWRLVFRA